MSLDSNFVQALYRGIEVIRAFAGQQQRLSLADLAKFTSLPRATVRRTLLTLGHMGYVETDGRLFWLTPRIMELAGSYLTSNPVTRIFQPLCDRLARELGHSLSTAVLDRGEAVVVAYAHGQPMSTNEAWIGLRLPAYCTALGRVLLSGLGEAELEDYLAGVVLDARTPFTRTDVHCVRGEIEKARVDGYSLVDQEASLGTCMVSVPIRRFDGKVVAALGFGSRVELTTVEAMLSDFLPHLQAAAADLTLSLG